MGFTEKTFNLCNTISRGFKNASILSLGNPFVPEEIIRKSNFSKENKKNLNQVKRNLKANYLFKEIYNVDTFKILDISDEEGADIIHDMNESIIDELLIGKFDYILDFGTQEHIFNTQIGLSNVFKLLKDNGKYIFSLPANGQLEHGFRQYSPTFFYDLCFANNTSLSIDLLSLISKRCDLNMLPLYENIDEDFLKTAGIAMKELSDFSPNHGLLTGTSTCLMNNLGTSVSILGVISKKKTKILNFKVTQCLYRNLSLDDVLPSGHMDKISKSLNLKSMVKKIILNFPISSFLKFQIISFFCKFSLRINR